MVEAIKKDFLNGKKIGQFALECLWNKASWIYETKSNSSFKLEYTDEPEYEAHWDVHKSDWKHQLINSSEIFKVLNN